MSSIPHWDYGYPLHVDEWWRYGDAQALIDNGRITYPDPFEADAAPGTDIEAGYHLWLGEIQLITGVSWLTLFRYLPGAILALLAFLAYAFGKEKGFGLGAALLAALVPTTVRLLGPAFLLPVALGLLFIPLALIILRHLMP
ncbi:hypothetical protein ACFLV2_01355, partial [Chloroflexota bacterium]